MDRAEKLIGLSMKVPIVEGSHFKCDDLEMGTIVESAEITYQEGAHALLLNLSGTHSGYAPVSSVVYCHTPNAHCSMSITNTQELQHNIYCLSSATLVLHNWQVLYQMNMLVEID